ncbi:signal peptidase II [Candidatus Peregrinibacteria bacterium]|nr:signal peptidase II [Candidatus Peregrinibacteria bacterium]
MALISMFIGLSILFFVGDQISKMLAETYLSSQDIPILQDLFRFHLSYNSNLALSLPFPLWAQISLSLALLIGMGIYFFWLHPVRTFPEILAVSLILGGALGNLMDRILQGKVVDFIAVWKFPVFNLADTWIFLGVSFFLLREIFWKK